MRLTFTRTATLLAALAALPLSAVADTIDYVTASDGQFGTVDMNTGAFHMIGTTPGAPMWGIADINGVIYGVNDSSQLVTINTNTAAASLIGSTGVAFTVVAGSGNKLFGLDTSNRLYSINLATGASTLIGSTGIAATAGESWANSLAGDGTYLYYTEELQGSTNLASTLYRINETTGAATTVGPTGIHDIAGSGYDNNTLYAFTTPFFSSQTVASIYTLNTSTGAATFDAKLDTTLGPVWGATDPSDMPETGTWGFLLVSLVLLGGVQIVRPRWAAARSRG